MPMPPMSPPMPPMPMPPMSPPMPPRPMPPSSGTAISPMYAWSSSSTNFVKSTLMCRFQALLSFVNESHQTTSFFFNESTIFLSFENHLLVSASISPQSGRFSSL